MSPKKLKFNYTNISMRRQLKTNGSHKNGGENIKEGQNMIKLYWFIKSCRLFSDDYANFKNDEKYDNEWGGGGGVTTV